MPLGPVGTAKAEPAGVEDQGLDPGEPMVSDLLDPGRTIRDDGTVITRH